MNKKESNPYRQIIIMVLFAVLTLLPARSALAGCEMDVADYEGWSIIYVGIVTGRVEEDGKREDDFEGCEYGRKLIVDDKYQVECLGYAYSYAYRPDIVILSNDSLAVACIDDEVYDVSLR
ncbi:hypothetical protein [Nisaea sediminum]|uniref:hypothetical protein n=1 Tax=Nisaea sediminum TaxID=2775867 RepID=UPI0018671A89|nr:hypothetical protein [Nisaea sediminum]